MVKHYTVESVFQFNWHKVVAAFWRRYPNPFSTHVLTEDVVQRYRAGNQLITKRLICKTGKFPKWAEKFVGKFHDVYLVEESILDLDSKTFTTYTRNISLQNVLTTTERCVYSTSTGNQGATLCHRDAWFESQIHGLGGMISSYGLQSYKKNIIKTFDGYNFVLKSLFANENHVTNSRSSETKKMTEGKNVVKKKEYGKEKLNLKPRFTIQI